MTQAFILKSYVSICRPLQMCRRWVSHPQVTGCSTSSSLYWAQQHNSSCECDIDGFLQIKRELYKKLFISGLQRKSKWTANFNAERDHQTLIEGMIVSFQHEKKLENFDLPPSFERQDKNVFLTTVRRLKEISSQKLI